MQRFSADLVRIKYVLSIMFILALMALGACDRADSSAQSQGGGPGFGKGGMGGGGQARSTPVRVTEVVLGSIDAYSAYVADTFPNADVRLASEVAGVVDAVLVDLGDTVEKGQVLARIRSNTFAQGVREAGASVAHARAAILRSQTDLDLAKKERDRAGQLHERGVLTQSEMDTIEGRYQAAVATLELARADAEQRRARLERARIDLSNTNLVAPFSGAIAERNVDPGALIGPGTHLFRIVDSTKVVIRFAAPEEDLVRFEIGQHVEVSFDAAGIPSHTGMIDRISPVLDPATRTTPVEVLIRSEGRVRPGMFARVNARLETRSDVPLIPAVALVRRQLEGDSDTREGVFVIRGEHAHFVPVKAGIRNRTHVEILEGPKIGDQIVVAGHSDLRDGASIRIVNGGTGSGNQGQVQAKKGKGRQDS